MRTPVEQIRDLRSELLLKLLFARQHGIEVGEMLAAQQGIVRARRAVLGDVVRDEPTDLVAHWRLEMAAAADRFLDLVVIDELRQR